MVALVFGVWAGVLGCSSDDPGGGNSADGGNNADAAPAIDAPPPDGPPADAFDTICGKPGDLGNEIGVGKFCNAIGDCSSTSGAKICATLGNPKAHFCTKLCQNEDAGVAACGTAATCTCGQGSCGCTPNACL
jgi:hypothetical protein